MKIGKFQKIFALILIIVLTMDYSYAFKAEAQNISNKNGLIKYTPNGSAFTIGFMDRSAESYPYSQLGMTVNVYGVRGTGTKSGYHEYRGLYRGYVPVGYWKLENPTGQCVHSSPGMNINWCGINQLGANVTNCHGIYNAGWIPYCSRCGERIVYMFFYITKSMASSVYEIPSGMNNANYFYLCPYDRSFETGGVINHTCKLLSANRYKVVYNSGAADAVGNMASSYFYYDNQKEYNGGAVNGSTALSTCIYQREGYVFLGWGTSPGGEVLFVDGTGWLEVQSSLNVGSLGNDSTIKLYAIWEEVPKDAVVGRTGTLIVTAKITRLLENIDGKNIFVAGEYGELSIKTRGNAQRVEVVFPDEMSEYNTSFDYSGNNADKKEEVTSFVVPPYDPEKNSSFVVWVIAYKADKSAECFPIIYLDENGGDVKDDLRTTLR